MHHPHSLFLPRSEQSAGVLAAVELMSTKPDITNDELDAAVMVLMEAAEERVGSGNVSSSHLTEAASILLSDMGCSKQEYRNLRSCLAVARKKSGSGGSGGKAGGDQRQRSRGDDHRQRSR